MGGERDHYLPLCQSEERGWVIEDTMTLHSFKHCYLYVKHSLEGQSLERIYFSIPHTSHTQNEPSVI